MGRMIRKIILFTVTACPMGRSMQTVVQEIGRQLNGIEHEVVYADVQHDPTNQYRITQNPTVVFLDERENEYYRVVGFIETQEMIDLIRRVETGDLIQEEIVPNAAPVAEEKYTVYLFEGAVPVPVETVFNNKTAVVTPRITAIRLLLKTAVEGLINPFPPNSVLTKVDFTDRIATVEIQVGEQVSSMKSGKMEQALLYTLRHFGIQSVVLQFYAETL